MQYVANEEVDLNKRQIHGAYYDALPNPMVEHGISCIIKQK